MTAAVVASLLKIRPTLGALAAAALLALPAARASDAHGEAKPAAKSAAKAAEATGEAPAKGGKGAAAVDPMDALREKLAQKLGATKAPEAPSPYVVRVVSKSGPAAHGEAKDGGGHGDAGPVVRKLRAEKAAAGHKPDAHAAHWSYAGDGGPEQWGQLKPEFAKCSTGTRQSPIDIRGGVKVDLEPIQFDYGPTGFGVVDNGHTIQVNLQGGNAIEVAGRRYDLVQFHFHRPSEERINGRQFDMVAHLVHKDPEGRLAVVAVLLDRGSAHPIVQTVWNNLPLEKGMEQGAQVQMDVNHLLPADRRYYTYMGSLTTPPCSEGVLWMVLQQPVPISNEQIAVFSKLYPMNARPIQQASGRLIKQSN
jgi:carbonic anhydrase